MSTSRRSGYARLPQSPVDGRHSRDISRDRSPLSPIDARRSILTTSTLDPETIEEIEAEEDAHGGVATVQAAEFVFTSTSRWLLFIGAYPSEPTGLALACYSAKTIRNDAHGAGEWTSTIRASVRGHHLSVPRDRHEWCSLRTATRVPSTNIWNRIGLASYVYSLDNQTTSNYLAFATSYFGSHSLISSIQVAQSILVACGKPVIAKVADVTSRGTAYLVVLVFYVLGYITMAFAPNIGAIAVGIILYAIGYTGLQLLTSVLIADITTLKWRGLVSGLTSAPFIVNAIIGSKIADAVLKHLGWRWGYGMFAILVPAALTPLILTLFWGERKAQKLGLVHAAAPRDDLAPPVKLHSLQRVWLFAEQLDLVGLVLLATAVALILVPMTLAQRAGGSWRNPSMIAMLVMGWLLLPVFALWDIKYAKRPVIARRFLFNRTVVCAAWIGFFDFLSFFLTFTYLPSFVLVTKSWSMTNVFYFGQAQTVGLTIFGIVAGVTMRFTQRYKPLLVSGLIIRLIGVALMVHSRSPDGSDAELVWTQILQGMGGGFAAICAGVAAQASVPHSDVAMVIALVLLWTEIGAGVGGSIAGAMWAGVMPGKLKEYLPGLTREEREALFGSITDVRARPLGDPVRQGVISAYSDTMKTMLIAATVLSVIPLLLSLLMPNWYLGDVQNAVEDPDLLDRRASIALSRADDEDFEDDDGDGEDGGRRLDV